MSIATRLKEIRLKLGQTQADFAASLKVALSTYNAYENGRQIPKSDLIVSICKKYKISADWLLELDPIIKIETEADLFLLYLQLRQADISIYEVWLSFGNESKSAWYVDRGMLSAYKSEYLFNTFDTLRMLESKVKDGSRPQSDVDNYIEGQLKYLQDKPISKTTDPDLALKIAEAYRNHLAYEKLNQLTAVEE